MGNIGKLFLLGVLGTVLSLPLAYLLATAGLWPRRRSEYGSTILSDAALWRIDVHLLASVLWPVTAPVVGALVGAVTKASPIYVASIAFTGYMVIGVWRRYRSAVRARQQREVDRRLSEATLHDLKPKILDRWGRFADEGVCTPEIRVRAHQTVDGVFGYVILRLSKYHGPPEEIAAHMSPIIPHYLKLRIESATAPDPHAPPSQQ